MCDILGPTQRADYNQCTTSRPKKLKSDGKHYAPRPNHDLTADQAVEAAKAYLLHNPDIESERRKHKSWYVGYDEPQQQNNFPDHHQSTFDGYRPSMGASHAFHPEVYQPKSLGSYISPTTTTLHHHTSTDPVDSKSNKFRVFQPKGLLKRRSRSVEKSLEQYAEEEEDGSNTQQLVDGHMITLYANKLWSSARAYLGYYRGTLKSSDYLKFLYRKTARTDLLYPHRWKPSTTTHYLENSTHSPLKSILKKASRFDEDHYDPWPDNRYNTPSNYHPMKTDNSQPGALTRLSSNDKLSYLAAEPLISRYSSRDVPPVTIRPYTHDKMDTIVDKTSAVSKKRSLLQHNRRKTTEIRLGTLTEALNSTAAAAGSDSPYRNKRAASPFEKIRNIFSKDSVGSSISRTSGEYGGHHPPHHHTTFAGEFSSGVRPSSVYEASVAYNRRGSSNYASGGRTKM
uniref:Uncharacterized protein n=1 Tax=Romanomermis culicivorax TaxID=13658 RepID=A0A915HIQ0_ROMCU